MLTRGSIDAQADVKKTISYGSVAAVHSRGSEPQNSAYDPSVGERPSSLVSSQTGVFYAAPAGQDGPKKDGFCLCPELMSDFGKFGLPLDSDPTKVEGGSVASDGRTIPSPQASAGAGSGSSNSPAQSEKMRTSVEASFTPDKCAPAPEAPTPYEAKDAVATAAGGDGAAGGLTLDHLRVYFHLPIEEAAQHLSVGLTVLKRICRTLGIARWPFRKLQSLQQLIDRISEEAQNCPPCQELEQALKMLKDKYDELLQDPTRDLEPSIRKLRQWKYKDDYNTRRAARAESATETECDSEFEVDQGSWSPKRPYSPSVASSPLRNESGKVVKFHRRDRQKKLRAIALAATEQNHAPAPGKASPRSVRRSVLRMASAPGDSKTIGSAGSPTVSAGTPSRFAVAARGNGGRPQRMCHSAVEPAMPVLPVPKLPRTASAIMNETADMLAHAEIGDGTPRGAAGGYMQLVDNGPLPLGGGPVDLAGGFDAQIMALDAELVPEGSFGHKNGDLPDFPPCDDASKLLLPIPPPFVECGELGELGIADRDRDAALRRWDVMISDDVLPL
ncbi:unnamed protein product [Pedinophyceae sp. YPF-701]|nr:unnamed protein product [Pedinophyceae sp. YPF-701]